MSKILVVLLSLLFLVRPVMADPAPGYPYPGQNVLWEDWNPRARYVVADWDWPAHVVVYTDTQEGCKINWATDDGRTGSRDVWSYRGISTFNFKSVSSVVLDSDCVFDNVVVVGVYDTSGGGHDEPGQPFPVKVDLERTDDFDLYVNCAGICQPDEVVLYDGLVIQRSGIVFEHSSNWYHASITGVGSANRIKILGSGSALSTILDYDGSFSGGGGQIFLPVIR